MTTPQDDGSKPTGFAGLDSLVSNVESDVAKPSSAPTHDAQPEEDKRALPEREGKAVLTPPSQEPSRTEGAATSGAGGRWAVAVIAGVGAIILFANIDRKSDVPAYSPADAPVASAPSQSISPSAGPSSSVEEMPPVGEDLVLNGPQIRWCVFEKARLETMKDLMSADQEVSAFNTYVGKYNERCARFQYGQEVLDGIEQELNQEGRRLQSEGAERILSLRSSPRVPETRKSATEQTQRAPRQETASEFTKDEPGKAAAILPAPSAKPVVVAPPIAATERDSLSDIEIVRSDFGLFSPPNSGKPSFQVSRRVPLQEGQGYGWYVELKTTKPRIKWREELVVPTPPATWGIQGSTAQHSISDDRRTLTTEREVAPNRGLIYNMWAVAAGDPKGPHIVRVYVEEKLVRTFEFETE